MTKELDYFLTIGQNSTAEFKDRGSKFIAYAFPIETVDDFKKQLANLKKSIQKLYTIALHIE
jgi:putative IMPACT (imprinted ancient) family translation regulator